IKKEAISFLPRAPLRGYRHSALPWAEVLRPFRPLTLNAPVSSNKNIDIISLPRRDRFANFLPPRNPTFPLLPIQTFNLLFIASLDRGPFQLAIDSEEPVLHSKRLGGEVEPTQLFVVRQVLIDRFQRHLNPLLGNISGDDNR